MVTPFVKIKDIIDKNELWKIDVKVQLNELVFKSSDHKYMVKFIRGTTIGDVNKHLILNKTIKIMPFGDIIIRRWKKDVLIGAGINDLLLVFDTLLGVEIEFKIKWQSHWTSCSVVMILQDEAVINQLKSPWEQEKVTSQLAMTPQLLQIKESVDEAKSDVVEYWEVVTEVEITFKHNPKPVRPTPKRQHPDGLSESTTLISLYDGELSSTKLKKIIK
ncbi:hypothetical protein KIW84_043119 [Lathyrus oleraceus]|uniref:Uncharacterized protein n=1 Tax=Pisum sativum TaxID=3888 RepID=A0A9D4XGM5_PEA|nr:hypothetical protein KIW84_043119 [Pisum sativum]